jgi:glycosyltransferase involved in cell wall biosynthesis
MLTSAPLVSVVIPAYNAEAHVTAAVDSVFAQSFRDFELIVVDDGSSDSTAARLGVYGDSLRCIRQPNAGVSRARNRGIEESRGRLVAFLDADDVWLPEKLGKQTSRLRAQTDCRACYTAVTVADVALRPMEVESTPPSEVTALNLLLRGNIVPGSASSILCARALFAETGGFDPHLSLCADWDMWLRLAARTRFAAVDEPLVVYRRTPGSMSRNARVLERDTLALLAKAFSDRDAPFQGMRARVYGYQYRVLSGSHLHSGLYRDALRCLMHSLLNDPRQALYALALPARAVQRRFATPSRGA